MPEKIHLVSDSGSRIHYETVLANLAEEEGRVLGQPLQSRVAEANQELATVLQDFRNAPRTSLERSPGAEPHHELLVRAVECAVKQRMLVMEFSNLAFTDELTGLYNRLGFLSLAERQLRLAFRAGCECLFFFIDVDDLKQINDTFGHSAGDLALVRTSEVLTNTFRESDIVARLGGDEFAALATEAASQSETSILSRLRERLEFASTNESRCLLSLSVGVVRFVPGVPSSIAELMLQADRAMYEIKRSHRCASAAAGFLPSSNGN
jgi:diguanylate cyclase (GGDEF)-like protein